MLYDSNKRNDSFLHFGLIAVKKRASSRIYRRGNCRLLTLLGSLLEPATQNALTGSQGRCGLHGVFFFLFFFAPKQSAPILTTTRTDTVAKTPRQTSRMSQKSLILDEMKKSCVISIKKETKTLLVVQ